MGERVPTSYSQEPVVPGGTTHEPSRSRSGGDESMEMASEGQSPFRQGARTGSSDPPKLVFGGGGAAGLFVDFLSGR